jgi:hypothetical protein
LRFRAADELGRDLGGGADGKPVIGRNGREQRVLVAAEIGLVVDLDATVAEDLDGGFGELVGDEYTGCHANILWTLLIAQHWSNQRSGPVDWMKSERACGRDIRGRQLKSVFIWIRIRLEAE